MCMCVYIYIYHNMLFYWEKDPMDRVNDELKDSFFSARSSYMGAAAGTPTTSWI